MRRIPLPETIHWNLLTGEGLVLLAIFDPETSYGKTFSVPFIGIWSRRLLGLVRGSLRVLFIEADQDSRAKSGSPGANVPYDC